MIRLILITCLLATSSVAQTPVDLDRLWTTFTRTCPIMVADPSAYMQNLAIPGPNGEPVVSQSADGQVTDFDTTISDDIHHGLIVVVGKHQEIGCGLTSNPLSVIQNLTDAEAGETFFRQHALGKEGLTISGGKVAKQVSMGAGTVETDTYFEYFITGLLPDVDTVAQVIFGQGFHSLQMHRYMIGEDSR